MFILLLVSPIAFRIDSLSVRSCLHLISLPYHCQRSIAMSTFDPLATYPVSPSKLDMKGLVLLDMPGRDIALPPIYLYTKGRHSQRPATIPLGNTYMIIIDTTPSGKAHFNRMMRSRTIPEGRTDELHPGECKFLFVISIIIFTLFVECRASRDGVWRLYVCQAARV